MKPPPRAAVFISGADGWTTTTTAIATMARDTLDRRLRCCNHMNDAPRDLRPRAHIERASDASGDVLRLTGAWRLAGLEAIDAELRALQLPARPHGRCKRACGARQRGRPRASVPPAAHRAVARPGRQRRAHHRAGAEPHRGNAGTAAAPAREPARGHRQPRQRHRPHRPRPSRVPRRRGPRHRRHRPAPAPPPDPRTVRAVRAGLPERDPGRVRS